MFGMKPCYILHLIAANNNPYLSTKCLQGKLKYYIHLDKKKLPNIKK